MELVVGVGAFALVMFALHRFLRRLEDDGSFDVPPGRASRAGVKWLFDRGPGGFAHDGIRQRPARHGDAVH